jgi:hypothetical protein
MTQTGGKGKRTCAEVLTCCVLLAGAALLLGSCGAINSLLSGDGKGLGDPFEYLLTIRYERSGMYITQTGIPNSVVFWVMPLDDNGEPMDDPENPDGPPLRYELVGSGDTGTVSASVPDDEYAILAFVDGDGDGALEISEPYEIYDNCSMRDGTFQKVRVDEAKTVDFVLDMLVDWHVVNIYYPRDGGTVNGDFHALFDALEKDNPNMRVYLNSTEIPFSYSDQNRVWYAPVYASQLSVNNNYLRVALYDQGGYYIDGDEVSFVYTYVP